MTGENWYLKVLRTGIEPRNEANTSRYVHEVLTNCLNWPFESIRPQPSKHGFIDYHLLAPKTNTAIRLEVKPFGKKLNDYMIRKYLVRPGPLNEEFRVGVLTNLLQWQIFLAGPEVKRVAGTSLACVLDVEVNARADIAKIDSMIGYRTDGQLRGLRASLGEATEVIRHVLWNDHKVLQAIRQALRRIRDDRSLPLRVPQTDSTLEAMIQLANGEPIGLEFSVTQFRQAICSPEVATVINTTLMTKFGSRSRQGPIKQTLTNLTSPESGEAF
ncbi:MAG TPA: hypothetical protein VK539_34605 [Myxococcaceae bacterium]|nr:hypothetical protein [Myxococcaceae bacterium]